ncbi:hypothetical protein GCM10023188_25670 [Pontibacter saemangeumensis]|uniref:Uncharacterized protein n=1 Tax=Pontibacter saemangeumensis TaxID=1084525 RepID=A0ABP8LSU9_9BACT
MKAEMILITIGGAVITVLLGIVAYFLIRLVNQLDSLDTQLNTLKTQLALYAQTVAFLQEKYQQLHDKYEELLGKYNALQKGVDAFDNYLNNKKRKP